MSESRWPGWKDRQDGGIALLGLNHENAKEKEGREKNGKIQKDYVRNNGGKGLSP